jgi:threonine dehydratase
MACAACGWAAADDDPLPFACPNAGTDGADHVVARVVDASALEWPADEDRNPFVRYRTLLRSYHVARTAGLSDEEYVAIVRDLDARVAEVDGHGFEVTPFDRAEGLDGTAGGAEVWVKDETGNVSGSHKGRHLFGVLIALEVAERSGLRPPADGERPLAIASCGNAALAAAVVALAGDRPLDVFVPTWADPAVVERLESLQARIDVVERTEGVPGDPTYVAMQDAVRRGAVPFTCQGPDDGLTIEGGQTLAYELVDQARARNLALDRLYVQVGGGALASAVVAGFADALALGAIERVPAICTVQSEGGYPLKRAYDRVAAAALSALGEDPALAGTAEGAALLAAKASAPEVERALDEATADRARYMWPWEEEPRSVAHGILDDETYDWMAVVRGMVATGGYPVLASEEDLIRANEAGRSATGIDADHTGTSGLGGVVAEARSGGVEPGERVAVLFTGKRRSDA